jgi:hypothetical protein
MKEEHTGFSGTYFVKEWVLRIARLARIASWVVLGVYGLQFLLSAGLMVSQAAQGFWAQIRFPDVTQNFLSLFEQVVPGVVYFFVLLGISQVLLILMDVEDNTRRSARQ